jgi:hypothetical protein
MGAAMRLGHAALAQNDRKTATQPFPHLLDHGGTPRHTQSVEPHVRAMPAKQAVLCPPPPAHPPPHRPVPGSKTRHRS